MMKRREFFGIAAALPTIAMADLSGVKSRQVSKWEIIYKSPHAKPNDLSMSSEGMWILDQGPESWVSLVNVADGKVIREFKTDVNAASGVTVDEHGVMWISSTHNSLMVSCSPKDGKTIAKYWTPGAGRIYQKKGDAAGRTSKLKPAYPAEPNQGWRRCPWRERASLRPIAPEHAGWERRNRRAWNRCQGRVALLCRSSCPFPGCDGPQNLGCPTNLAGAWKPYAWADVGRKSRDTLECRFESQRISFAST